MQKTGEAGDGRVLRPRRVRPRRGPGHAPRRPAGNLRRQDRPAPPTPSAPPFLTGYVDLVHRKAYRLEGGAVIELPSRRHSPAGHEARDQLLEAAAEADDACSRSTSARRRSPTPSWMRASTRASASRSWRPCSSPLPPRASASARSWTRSSATSPRPRRRAPTPRRTRPARTSSVAMPTSGQLLVRVFKTAADPFVGRLTYLRVLSGTLKSQGGTFNATKGEDERIGQLLLPARQGAGAGRRAARRRDRRRGQAGRDRDRRHALDP